MNLLTLSGAYLRTNPLNTFLNLLLLALGMGTIVVLLLFSQQLEQRLLHDSRGIDLVVGAKGSPLQLILSSIYHADIPTGNIPLRDAKKIMQHKRVKTAIPLALGDNYHGYRIVGTTPTYPAHYDASLAQGRLWQKPLEATLGAEVARQTGLYVGAQFVGAHGLTHGTAEHLHGEYKYTVTGILKPTGTVIDRLILTSIESVWKVHEEQQEHEQHSHANEPEHDEHEARSHVDEQEHDEHEARSHVDEQEHDEHEPRSHAEELEHDEHEPRSHAEELEHDEHEHRSHAEELEHDKHEPRSHAEKPKHEAHSHTKEHDHDEEATATHAHNKPKETPHDDITDDEHEITALLIQYQSPLAAVAFPRMINSKTALQAASPAFETARLLKLVGFGIDTLRAFGILLIITATLSMFIALYHALKERRYDLAIMRTLGAGKTRLLWQLLFEGLLMALLGTLLGLLLGHIVTEMLGLWLNQAQQLHLTGWTYIKEEYMLFGLALLIGTASALLPAIQAYRTDIAKTLSNG
jgi:putative ABC transport system permease protein